VWPAERVRRWRATGEVPSSVMVWTPQQSSALLKRAASHEQYVLFLLLAFTGMRRGEAVGLRWADVDVEAKVVLVVRQVVQIGWATEVREPKSEAGIRPVMLSDELVLELAAHRRRQDAARIAAGKAWADTGLVFTGADGSGLHPAWASAWFKQLAREAGLPPVRLHDLRHGAASLMLAANVDIKVV
jgi:integrase